MTPEMPHRDDEDRRSACDPAYEDQMYQYIDGHLLEDGRRRLEDHLQSCGRCETYWKHLQALDASLAAQCKAIRLSEGFSRRVMVAVVPLRTASDAGWIAERKEAFESDYRERCQSLRGSAFRSRLLKQFGEELEWALPVVILFGGLLVANQVRPADVLPAVLALASVLVVVFGRVWNWSGIRRWLPIGLPLTLQRVRRKV